MASPQRPAVHALRRRREELRDWLRRTPADPLESGFAGRMQELLASAVDPFSRSHFDPGHFTASAWILSPDRTALAMIFHAKLLRWLQPGGHVEPGDPGLAEAARREAAEETGLETLELERPGPLDLDIHPIPARGAEPGHLHFDVRFLFRSRASSLRARAEVRAAESVPLARLSRDSSEASIRRVLGKL